MTRGTVALGAVPPFEISHMEYDFDRIRDKAMGFASRISERAKAGRERVPQQ